MMLKGKRVVVGITGSIAAYKIPFLVRLLIKEGAEVRIIMTRSATDFVTPLTLSTLSNHPVVVEPFNAETGEWSNHVELGRWADVMIFAPVTANTLGKMAHGIADNFLATAYLSAKCPVFIAPAMDLDMYAHPSTRENILILQRFGNHIIEPQTGELASGLCGAGRLEEPESILSVVRDHFQRSSDLSKKKVLVTAGPTREKIDPVRYIGNYSTGKMGFSLAYEAALRGASVTLVSGPSCMEINHPLIRRLNVESAAEMYDVCLREAVNADIVIMAAAVADYTVEQSSPVKLKKDNKSAKLELTPTMDILAELGKRKKKKQILVGFALETDHEVANATGKLKKKNLDLIVLNSLNDQGAGFGLNTNKISIIDSSGAIHHGTLRAKPEIAADIIDYLVKNGKTSL